MHHVFQNIKYKDVFKQLTSNVKYPFLFSDINMNVVYGPVASWRLGKSLGVDLICSKDKICSFDCIYCQIEKTNNITTKKNVFVPINRVKKEITSALEKTKPDVITFSGMGEPTLAGNMNEVIDFIRENTGYPIAILTNSSLLFDKQVQRNLQKLDVIVAKLDAPNEKLFQSISQPAEGISFEQTIRGIKEMREKFNGKFALQMMFMDINKDYAEDMADLAREIHPDEVQINTPLRPCNVKPLSVEELDNIEKHFSGLKTLSVYHSSRPMTDPLDKLDMLKRRRQDF